MDERARVDDSELITEAEAARRIGVTVRTMQRWRAEKNVPHLKFGTNIRYRWAALSAWATTQAILARQRSNASS